MKNLKFCSLKNFNLFFSSKNKKSEVVSNPAFLFNQLYHFSQWMAFSLYLFSGCFASSAG